MYKYFFSLLFCSLAGLVSAQGWERVYGGSGQDDLSGVAITPDGGFVMTGYYNSETQIYLIKADANGDLQFSKKFPYNTKSAGRAIVVTQDGGYAIAGFTQRFSLQLGSQRDFCLLKTDASGNLLWIKSYGATDANEEANGLIELADGSLVLAGFQKTAAGEQDLLVVKTDASGNQLGTKVVGGQPGSRETGYCISKAPNGDLIVAGEYKSPAAGSNSEVLVLRLDASLNKIWQKNYDAVPQVDDIAYASVVADDGNIVVAGLSYGQGLIMKVPGIGGNLPLWINTTADSTRFYGLSKDLIGGYYACGARDVSGAQIDLKVEHFNGLGSEVWSRTVGRPGVDIGKAAVTTRDGGVAAAGFSERFYDPLGFGQPDGYLVKVGADGVVFNSYIQGNVFRDFNGNCALDGGEPALRDWILQASSPNLTRYTVSRSDGSYQFAVDTGTYALTLVTPNDYWQACTGVVTVSVPNFTDTAFVDIPVRGQFDCPRNEVNIATPLLHQCADNVYTVRYCNTGTIPSPNTEVIVKLDSFLTLTGSSIPATPLGGNRYQFDIGTLPDGDCGNFTLTAFLNCDNTLTGQTHCATAHIYPDTFCNPGPWNGAFIQAVGSCDGDSVRLSLKNIGNNPTTTSYVIIEDVIMLVAPTSVNIGAAATLPIYVHSAEGSTFRIIASQEPSYPGNSIPTAAVEGCANANTPNDSISLGFYTMFPDDDGDAFVSSDCQESYPITYNPQLLKRGHPKGYDVAHYVSPETDLDYLIRFTNTGVDTVQQVTIRDTLSAALDPTTVHPGAASHPYQLDIYGNGIVQFTFSNVHLAPDSSANEGYVRFRVSQKPNLDLCGTTIFNSAAIYFDYNAPEYTNETFHTVCAFDSFIVVKTVEYYRPTAQLKVYPNPMTDGATFELTGVNAHIYRLELYDMQGRALSRESFNQPTFQLFRHQLPAGLILYRLTADGQPVAAGKLLVQSRE
ncbi:MAG: T9SS type A sorting domain-containing protein [Saprospiraceae bacterium]